MPQECRRCVGGGEGWEEMTSRGQMSGGTGGLWPSSQRWWELLKLLLRTQTGQMSVCDGRLWPQGGEEQSPWRSIPAVRVSPSFSEILSNDPRKLPATTGGRARPRTQSKWSGRLAFRCPGRVTRSHGLLPTGRV